MQSVTDYNLKVMCNLWHWIYHLNDIIGDMNVVLCMKIIFSYEIDVQFSPINPDSAAKAMFLM